MKIVCYFADADGAHPNCSTSDYDVMWPVMQRSVERHGYELIHLTDLHDKPRCTNTIRYDLDSRLVMFSREIAWLRFLESIDDNEQLVLVEPDAYLLRPIPPLADGKDVMFLHRPHKNIPCGFRLARKSAAPFYRAVVETYAKESDSNKTFHGDVGVHHALLGIGPSGIQSLPDRWRDIRIEHRNWIDYTSKLWKNAVAWNFKGTSKHYMLDLAKGKQPPLR